MKISLKGMSNRELGKLFDRAAKANDRRLCLLCLVIDLSHRIVNSHDN